MPLYTRAQFADLCGLNAETARAFISTNIKRGKIILSGDFIDDEISVNKSFLLNAQKNAAKKQASSPPPSPAETKTAPEEKIKSIPFVAAPEFKTNSKKKFREPDPFHLLTDAEQKAADLEYKLAQTRLLNLREQKLTGETIPTALAILTISQHSQSIVTEFNNGISDLLTLFSKKHGLNTNEIAEMRGEIVLIINAAVDKAVNLSQKNIDNIVSEFAVKREVGERE